MLDLSIGLCSLVALIRPVFGSAGDRSPYFRYCRDNCLHDNCSPKELQRCAAQQSIQDRLTRWYCEDECAYSCMWVTVGQFEMEGRNVPQFYGKWPFLRWFGMQEPASTIFSLLNLLSNTYMFYVVVFNLSKDVPLRTLWITYSLVAVFAWIWSAVFHTRDIPLTEKMDYFCAFATVVYGLYTCLVRILGTEPFWRITLIGVVLLSYYLCHCYYLGFVRFDYGYNMTANITIGLANSCSWLVWCGYQYFVHGHRYVWRCAVVIVCVMALLALELYDFPPVMWIFDAHSLWHLGTSPLALLWTRFVLDDSERLRYEREQSLMRKLV